MRGNKTGCGDPGELSIKPRTTPAPVAMSYFSTLRRRWSTGSGTGPGLANRCCQRVGVVMDAGIEREQRVSGLPVRRSRDHSDDTTTSSAVRLSGYVPGEPAIHACQGREGFLRAGQLETQRVGGEVWDAVAVVIGQRVAGECGGVGKAGRATGDRTWAPSEWIGGVGIARGGDQREARPAAVRRDRPGWTSSHPNSASPNRPRPAAAAIRHHCRAANPPRIHRAPADLQAWKVGRPRATIARSPAASVAPAAKANSIPRSKGLPVGRDDVCEMFISSRNSPGSSAPGGL